MGRSEVTRLLGQANVAVDRLPASTGRQLLDVLVAVSHLSEQLRLLQRELKLEYHLPFVYRGIVRGHDVPPEQIIHVERSGPVRRGDVLNLHGLKAAVVKMDDTVGPGFDGLMTCERV